MLDGNNDPSFVQHIAHAVVLLHLPFAVCLVVHVGAGEVGKHTLQLQIGQKADFQDVVGALLIDGETDSCHTRVESDMRLRRPALPTRFL